MKYLQNDDGKFFHAKKGKRRNINRTMEVQGEIRRQIQ